MKRILAIVLVLALAVGLGVTAFATALNPAPAAFTASGTTALITVSGTFESGSSVTAAAVEVRDSGNNLVAFKTFAVTGNAFSGTISAALTAGAAYTAKAANYDGGEWKTVTFTVPGADVILPEPDGVVPAESGAGSAKLGAIVSGGTAMVTATDAQIKALIASAGGTGNVAVDLSALDANAASLPAAFVSAAQSDSSVTGLTLRFRDAALTLDKPALAGLPVNGGRVAVFMAANPDLSAAQTLLLGDRISNTVTADFTLTSGGTEISNLGGKAVISLKIAPSMIADPAALRVWCIDDPMNIENMGGIRFDAAASIVSFETAHNSVYAAVSFPFTDVSDDSWAYSSVAYAYMNKLFEGTSGTTFSPETTMTRGMLVTVLWRLDGSPAAADAGFSDLSQQWYKAAVGWAAANGIVDGYGNGKFGPEDAVTREQTAAILWRYAKYKGRDVSVGEDTNLLSYGDASDISEYAVPAFQWACGAGIIEGSGGKLTPADTATRAQVAAVLRRFCRSAAE